MQKVRETTILKCLGQENNQNFARLKITTKLGTESLVLGLKELMDKKLVKKDPETKIYTLQSETKNKTLELLKKNHVYGDDPEILEKPWTAPIDNMPQETIIRLICTSFNLSYTKDGNIFHLAVK